MDLLRDDIKQLFVKFFIPAIGSALVVTVYSFVDTIAIGQGVGAKGTAACAVTLPLFCIAEFLGLMCGIGGSVLFSRARGSNNIEKSNAYFTAALVIGTLLSVILWVGLLLFQEPFYRLYGADDVIMRYAIEYGSLIVWTFPIFVFSPLLAGFIRNDGDPKLVLAASLAGAGTNILGDWLLVFPLNMGMLGAALATVLGAVLQLGVMVTYFFSKKNTIRIVKPYHARIAARKILANGFGTGLSQLSVIVVTLAANNQIMKYAGSSALAVYGVICTLATLFTHIFSGIGQSAQPIASSNFGAGALERYWGVYKVGLNYTLWFGIIFTGVCMIIPAQITAVFVKPTPEILEMAPFALRIYSLSFIPLGINTFLSIYLQSIMKPKEATLIAVMRGLAVICVLLIILPVIWGIKGIWYAFASADTLVAVIGILYTIKLRNYTRMEAKNEYHNNQP